MDNIERYVQSINDRMDKIKKIQDKNKSFNISVVVKNSISDQLETIRKNKESSNKITKNTKEYIRKSNIDNKNYISTLLGNIKNNKCVKSVLGFLKTVYNSPEKLLKMMKVKFINLLESTTEILTSVKTYVVDKLSSAFSHINNLLHGVPGKIWDGIKFLSKAVVKVFNWTWKVGKVALDYIWSGVKTIFNVSMAVISKSINYLLKGTKAFFTWWFKMFLNTLFNPAMAIVNVPLFALITTVVFSAVGLLLTMSAGIFLPIFETSMDIGVSFGKWIYTGISWLFNWLKTQYEGSFLQTKIVDPAIKWIKDKIPDTIKNIFGSVQTWVTTAYAWITTKGSGIIDNIQGYIKSFYNAESGETMFRKILNLIVNGRYFGNTTYIFPNTLRKIVRNTFGFIISGEGEFGDQSVSAQLRKTTKYAEKKIVSHTIELEYAKLKAANKGLKEEEIIKILEQKVIPSLTSTVIKTLKSSDIEDSIKTGINIAKNALDKKINFINESFVQNEIKGLHDLMIMKKQIENGDLNPADPAVIEYFKKSIEDKKTLFNNTKLDRTNSEISNSYSDIATQLENVKKSVDMTSVVTTIEFIKENDKKYHSMFGTVYDTINAATDRFFSHTSYSDITGAGMAQLEQLKGQQVDVSPIKSSTPLLEAIPAKAHGDIMFGSQKTTKNYVTIPDKEEMSKTLALDSKGIEFIKSKVKEIINPLLNTDQKNTKKKDIQSSITIIEEQNNYTESYEIYTMDKISKGILRN